MKILYFDTRSLLYSHQYIHSDESVHAAFEEWVKTPSTTPLKMVKPDPKGINRLRSAAIEAGLLLYPLGTHYTRELLIENGVFGEDELAPEAELPFRMGMDDSDPVRQMIAHAHRLKAEWYVCGDTGSKELLQPYPERYLSSEFGEGVTSELIDKIISLK
ncbi:hypothetical protein C4G56_RS17375 [Vibrio parahaemolyticus]|uniref:hypothetical protein n=1 Tax=Vibrio parahaemolyticus TaxID=670 RepID=UPI0004A3A87D|nr:hypothetical protein [Vibrio parahaemolyticus]EGR0082922.1 hypothetical protein [Vibrio vulnificus]EGR4675239.1 hypothetical protein [Vibrio parahaemolyticus]EHR6434491.1 hypothetical protein [Vibrio parahaemolyticus]EHR6582541.1 hypothetical protein [Vibrio parahaemolyticus]EJG0415243.1 hypothetical protein [Vibrio parahaemolyticus]